MGNSQEPQDFNTSVMPSSLTPVHVAKADQIRDTLAEAGITIEDGLQGSTWSLK